MHWTEDLVIYNRFGGYLDTRIDQMTSPVRCTHCSGIYDLGTVTVTARYVDCSMWTSPCCGRQVDDRGDTGWKSFPDYRKLDSEFYGFGADEWRSR